jgi:hypothetical protein
MSFLPREDVDIPISVDLEGGHGGAESDDRSATVMHMQVIEYLKTLKPPLQATFTDVQKELAIDLSNNRYGDVLHLLLSNAKVECERRRSSVLNPSQNTQVEQVMMLFRYKAKFDISNRSELIREIAKVASGVTLRDLTNPPVYVIVLSED